MILTPDDGGAIRKLENFVIKGKVSEKGQAGENLNMSYKEWNNTENTYYYFEYYLEKKNQF